MLDLVFEIQIINWTRQSHSPAPCFTLSSVFNNYWFRAGVTAQLVKRLPCKHVNLDSVPEFKFEKNKKQGVRSGYSTLVIQCWGGRDGLLGLTEWLILWFPPPATHTQLCDITFPGETQYMCLLTPDRQLTKSNLVNQWVSLGSLIWILVRGYL